MRGFLRQILRSAGALGRDHGLTKEFRFLVFPKRQLHVTLVRDEKVVDDALPIIDPLL